MWRIAVLLCLTVVSAQADPNDLTGGVLILHHPPDLAGTCLDEHPDVCEAYDGCLFRIHGCDEEITQANGAVWLWYVLAAFAEDKLWCGVEFGMGDYDPLGVGVVTHGPCPPSALWIPYGDWPGPNTGISLASAGTPWSGNFEPVYWFACYAYYPGMFPLAPHPGTGFGGFANCTIPSTPFAAECFGAMGLFQPGVPCCPTPPTPRVCCVGESCVLVGSEYECAGLEGIYHPEWDSCGPPNPCEVPVRHVCCLGFAQCYLVFEEECEELQGIWHPEWDSCGPPNPCPSFPAGSTSWGSIKTLYR